MNMNENKTIVDICWQEILNNGNFERLYDLIHKDYVYHAPGGSEVRGPDGLKQFVTKARENVPDLHFTVEDFIAEGDKVVSRYTMQGTPKAVGKQLTLDGMMITRIANGKVVEDWESIDRLSMAQQGAKGWFQKRIINGIASQLNKGLGLPE